MRVLVVLLGATALVGCASRDNPLPLATYQTVATAEPAAPDPVGTDSYRIGALDQLRIDVFGEPELSVTQLPVDPTGRINMPLVGPVIAEGSTTAELSERIAAALQRYLRQPQVAVNVIEFTSQKITVDGAVRTPGVFQAVNQMTLMDAIALGQGLNDASKEDEILVFRRQNGQRYVARFDLSLIQAGQAVDPMIQSGDVVVVGRSRARALFRDALAVLPLAVGVFIALIN